MDGVWLLDSRFVYVRFGVCCPVVHLYPATLIHPEAATHRHVAMMLSRSSDPPCCIQAFDWHWWDNSKRTCTDAVRKSDPELGATTCCYGWIDMAFFPRHMHAAFVRGTVTFWEVAYT